MTIQVSYEHRHTGEKSKELSSNFKTTVISFSLMYNLVKEFDSSIHDSSYKVIQWIVIDAMQTSPGVNVRSVTLTFC